MSTTFGIWDKNKAITEDEMFIPGSAGKFHDLERVYEATKDWDIPPYFINFVGARGNGKTGTLNNLMMDAYNEGRQSIWTRNFENTFLKPSFYNGFLNLGKRYNGVPEEFTAKPDGVYSDVKGGDMVCMFKSINMGTELKGNEYRNVKYLLCDEFMVLSSERYPSGAPEKLGVMMASLRTYADACVMASNFTYITNPYWASMNIFPKYNKGCTVFKDLSAVIEVCEKGYYNQMMYRADDPRANAINRLQSGKDHSNYDSDPNFELIETIPIKYVSRVDFDIRTTAINIGFYEHPNGMIYAKKTKPNNNMAVYVTDPKLMNEQTVFIPPVIINWLKSILNSGKMRFFEANTLYEIMRIIHKI